jgi:hypothetical protein
MTKFACFERTIEALYKHVVPKPKLECTYIEQLVVTFAAGYIAGGKKVFKYVSINEIMVYFILNLCPY